jgi:hypothetical protein
MNFSSENYNNMNASFSENFSDIKYKEPTVFCDGLYCGLPMEKTFAKYENRNFTSTKSDYGFNAPVFNEKRSKKFKSLASELQRVQYTKDKRVFTPISSPSGFSDFEPIQGLFRDITLDGAIRSKQRGVVSSSKLSSTKSDSSELKNSTIVSQSQSTDKSTQRNTENTTDKSKLSSSIVSSVYPNVKSSTLSSPSVPKKSVSISTVSSVPTSTTKTTKPSKKSTLSVTTPSLSDVISKTSTTVRSSKK